MYVKSRVWLIAQLCTASRLMQASKPQSSSRYLYKNALDSNASQVSIRPDCSRLIIHEMPHACTRHGWVVRIHFDLGFIHLLAFQPLHPSGLVGGV